MTALAPGALFAGRYQITRPLGQGASGSVYHATDGALGGRPVALKILRPELAVDEETLAILEREAMMLLDLTHENIVRLHNFEVFEGQRFLVMEYVEGSSLSAILAARVRVSTDGVGHLSLDEVVPLARQVAAALDYAHSRRVTHRDIKPANILVTPAGQAKVADFGIAGRVRDTVSRLAQSVPSGTLAYMAPEQARGEAVSPATDLYGFAATVYHLLAGHPPFVGGDIFRAIQESAPPPIAGLAPAAAGALWRALAKNPSERFPDASSFALALAGQGPVGPVPSYGPPASMAGTSPGQAAVTSVPPAGQGAIPYGMASMGPAAGPGWPGGSMAQGPAQAAPAAAGASPTWAGLTWPLGTLLLMLAVARIFQLYTQAVEIVEAERKHPPSPIVSPSPAAATAPPGSEQVSILGTPSASPRPPPEDSLTRYVEPEPLPDTQIDRDPSLAPLRDAYESAMRSYVDARIKGTNRVDRTIAANFDRAHDEYFKARREVLERPPPSPPPPPPTPSPVPTPSGPAFTCEGIVELSDGFRAFVNGSGPFSVGSVTGTARVQSIDERQVTLDVGDHVVVIGITGAMPRASVSVADAAASSAAIQQADDLYHANRDQEAAVKYREGRRLDPTSLNAAFGLALTLISQKKFGEARQEIEVGILANPDSAKLYNALAYVLLQLRDAPAATRMAHRATVLDPQLGDAWETLGQAYSNVENWIGARDAFERALQIDSTLSTAREGLETAKRKLSPPVHGKRHR